jgi:hypothetical protein
VIVTQTGREADRQQAVFVSADLIFLPRNSIASLRKQIFTKWGIAESSILLHATHTHSSPYPAYGYYASVYDSTLDEEFDNYIKGVEAAVMEGIGNALNGLEPVTIERGSGQCLFSSYRRKEEEGKWVMAPNDKGPNDQEVSVIRFKKRNGTTKALMVHYTCHPTTTYEDFYSSDYPGTAMDLIEERLEADAVSMFLQGCCGDIRPGIIREGHYVHGSESDVLRLAGLLAEEVTAVLERPLSSVKPSHLISRSQQVELPFRTVPSMDELEANQDDPGLMGRWSRKLLANPQFLTSHDTLELTYIQLANELSFLAMSGEMVVAYGLNIKQEYKGTTIPIGYTNGNAGYIPTAEQLEQGGYEAYDFFYKQGLPSPYDSRIEDLIREAISELVPSS